MPFHPPRAWRSTEYSLDHDPESYYADSYDQQRHERNLWAACLIAGIADLVKVRGISLSSNVCNYRHLHIEQAKRKALEWLLEERDTAREGSFVFCCEACGIDPTVLRRRVLWLLQNDRKRLKTSLSHLHAVDNRSSIAYGQSHSCKHKKHKPVSSHKRRPYWSGL